MISLEVVMLFIWKVRPDGECWIWTGARKKSGYGAVSINGRPMLAHRAALLIFRGTEVPKGCSDVVVDHLCRNRACVRPDHLEIVTPKINGHRGLSAPRTHCRRGHEFTPDNTTYNPQGTRKCRTCRRLNRERHAAGLSSMKFVTPTDAWHPPGSRFALHRENEK